MIVSENKINDYKEYMKHCFIILDDKYSYLHVLVTPDRELFIDLMIRKILSSIEDEEKCKEILFSGMINFNFWKSIMKILSNELYVKYKLYDSKLNLISEYGNDGKDILEIQFINGKINILKYEIIH